MELEFIYTDSNRTELGQLSECDLDIEIGKYKVASNDFELKMNQKNWNRAFDKGSFFYDEDSEFGGLVKAKGIDTATNDITFKGPTFRGLLEKEYIQPPNGQAYLVLKSGAGDAIRLLIDKRFGDLFVVDKEDEPINVNYQVRDMNLLDAIERMLLKADKPSRIDIKYKKGHVHLKAVPIRDLSDEVFLDNSYHVAMKVEEPTESFNHILCLGTGELTERIRVNLYRQKDGSWTEANTNLSFNKQTYKYEDTNEADVSELKKKAIEKVNEANGSNTVSVTFDSDTAELFDIVAAKEEITGVEFKEHVAKKILKAKMNGFDANVELEHKVGDNK